MPNAKPTAGEMPLRRVVATLIRNNVRYEKLECGHERRVRDGVAGKAGLELRHCPLCVAAKKKGA